MPKLQGIVLKVWDGKEWIFADSNKYVMNSTYRHPHGLTMQDMIKLYPLKEIIVKTQP